MAAVTVANMNAPPLRMRGPCRGVPEWGITGSEERRDPAAVQPGRGDAFAFRPPAQIPAELQMHAQPRRALAAARKLPAEPAR